MSFFSLDSKFSQIMGRVFDLMMLNIIFLIMCIPIVTIGANFTAMYYVTLKMIKNEETYIFRTYWKSFRENFKQATAIWLILLAVLIVLILDLLLVMRMPGTITYLRFVFLVLIFFEAMVLSYVFPVLSRFDNTVKNTIKNSILMAIRHLPWTIMILLVNLCPLLIYVFSTTKIVSEIAELKVPLTEVQEDLKKLRDIRYWVRKATPGTEESKEPPKKQPIKEVLQDKADEKKAQRTAPAQTKHRQQDMEL